MGFTCFDSHSSISISLCFETAGTQSAWATRPVTWLRGNWFNVFLEVIACKHTVHSANGLFWMVCLKMQHVIQSNCYPWTESRLLFVESLQKTGQGWESNILRQKALLLWFWISVGERVTLAFALKPVNKSTNSLLKNEMRKLPNDGINSAVVIFRWGSIHPFVFEAGKDRDCFVGKLIRLSLLEV